MTPCILWTGAKNGGGYGVRRFRGKNWLAHRAAYTVQVGEIPTGLELDHLCRTPSCVNVDHLEAVTHRENMARSPANQRHAFCVHGHSMADAYKRPTKGYDCRTCRRDRNRRYKAKLRLEAVGGGPTE